MSVSVVAQYLQAHPQRLAWKSNGWAGRIDKRIQNHYFGFYVVIFLLLISALNSQDLKDSLWAWSLLASL